MIDIDDFKAVNDTKGHMLGDVVLSEMAMAMERVMGEGHIIGRIGGDEFIIFMKNIELESEAQERAGKILKEFQTLFQNSL